MTDEPIAKRPKIRLACQECRDRKIRCDGGRPTCGSCIRKRLSPDRCVYADATGVEASSEYVRSLESRIRDLEHRSSPQQSRDLPPFSSGSHYTSHVCAPQSGYPAPFQYRPIQSAAQGQHQPPESPAQQGHDARQSIVLGNSPRRRLTGEYSRATPSDASASHESTNTSNRRTQGQDPAYTGSSGRQTGVSPTRLTMGRRPSTHQPPPDVGGGPERGTMGVEGFVEQGQGVNDGTSVYLGRSSAAAFLNEVRSKFLKRHRGKGDDVVPPEESVSSASKSPRAWSRKMEQDLADLMQQLVLPPRRVADNLLGYYWRYIWPFNPILHRKTFQRRYEEIWTQNGLSAPSPMASDNDEDVDFIRSFYALFNIMIALGSLYSKEGSTAISTTEQNKANAFFERAESLMTDKSFGNDNLISVQVHIMMAQYLQTTGKVNKCWVEVGTAIRIAQGIGIHVCPPSESQAHHQERRRTWSYCIQMDRILGMMFGRQPMVAWSATNFGPALTDDEALSMEPYTANNPVPLAQDSVLGFFVYADRYSEILLDVLKAMYNPLRSHGKEAALDHFQPKEFYELLQLDHLVKEWHDALPDSLSIKSDADFRVAGINASQATATLCRYLHLKILLFRPAAVEAARSKSLLDAHCASDKETLSELQRSLILGCARSCLSAAQDIVKAIHRRCICVLPLPNWWHSTFYVFTAGTVVLSVMTSRFASVIHAGSSEPLETTWKQAMEVFTLYEQDGVPFARQCAWTLQTALEQSRRDTASGSDSRDSNSNASADGKGQNEGEANENEVAAEAMGSHELGPDGDINLADAVLGEYWWHTAGLQWLENIDVPDEFVASEPMNVEQFDHAST